LNANCKGNYLKYQVIIWRRIVDKKSSDKYDEVKEYLGCKGMLNILLIKNASFRRIC
jgi:hypothetical protein